MASTRRSDDHDLLIRIDTKLDQLSNEFKQFQTSTEAKFALKADVTEVSRLEDLIEEIAERLKGTERFVWGALGIIGFIEAAAGIAIAIHYFVR